MSGDNEVERRIVIDKPFRQTVRPNNNNKAQTKTTQEQEQRNVPLPSSTTRDIPTTGDTAVVPPRPSGPVSLEDNPGAGPFRPPAAPPPQGPPGGDVITNPPSTGGGPVNPSDLQIYIYDSTRQVLIPFKADYSLAIPFTFADSSRITTRRKFMPKQDKRMGVIIPLIKIAPNASDWMQLASLAQRHPYNDVIAIVNPSKDSRGISGTGSPSAEFANGINYLVNAGVRIVGYVNTDMHAKTIASVMDEINKWFDWYPNVSGIYFDDSAPDNKVSDISPDYYKQIDDRVKQKHRQVQGSKYYVQQQAGAEAITILNLAAAKSPATATTNPILESLYSGTDINIFTIYEQEGFPTDQNYLELKQQWMANEPRSRFAVISYHAPENDIEIRNFVDKAIEIEAIAGYVYATTEWITNLSEAAALSPLAGTIMDQIDALAQQSRIPTLRGTTPSSETPSGEAFASVTDMSERSEENVAPRQHADFDKLGVRKIYPTSSDKPFEWYLQNGKDLKKDPTLRNIPKAVRILDDGKFETMKRDVDQVRIEAWTNPKQKKMLNVEISGYFRVLEADGRYIIQQYARGGHHYRDQAKWCEGSAYKGRMLKNGSMCAVKEVHHQGYTNNRGMTQATNRPTLERWFGMKTIIYNYPIFDTRSNTLTDSQGVAIELWIDDNADDGKGRLVVKNDWRHVATIRDQGGWFASEKDFLEDKCKALALENKSRYRKRDEIINTEGGTAEGNCVAWRWDQATVQFSHLSVREIRRVIPD